MNPPVTKPPASSEVTPERLYARRREFIKNAGLMTATAAGFGGGLWSLVSGGRRGPRAGPGGDAADAGTLEVATRGQYVVDEALTSWNDATTYNNFYEFGLDKSDPARNSHTLRPRPWTVEVSGEVQRPGTFSIDDLVRSYPLEERVYRMRCVEAWSMVLPWLGFPLAALLAKVEPLGTAKYVAFTTLKDTEQMPQQTRNVLEWPYVEGLRLDEAMNPLTLLAVGLYGKPLPNQNGAPLRLVVPWKYGFKGIKSIVKLELVREQPRTSWNLAAPDEYGFFANVNPNVPHPRWSQASERRVGELERRPTRLFNGYEADVAALYSGMDLTRFF